MERDGRIGGGDKEGERESLATEERTLIKARARSPKAPNVSMAKGVRSKVRVVGVSR